jgi:hypothetical protein
MQLILLFECNIFFFAIYFATYVAIYVAIFVAIYFDSLTFS